VVFDGDFGDKLLECVLESDKRIGYKRREEYFLVLLCVFILTFHARGCGLFCLEVVMRKYFVSYAWTRSPASSGFGSAFHDMHKTITKEDLLEFVEEVKKALLVDGVTILFYSAV
jgi:hypothetical protein